MTTNYKYDDEDLASSLSRNRTEVLPEEIEAEKAAEGRGELEFSVPEATPAGLWFPTADSSIGMHVRGNYADRYPRGAVVHFTAGRRERGDVDAEQTMKHGKVNGHLYFCISSTGKVYQPAPLNKWGSHCGASSHTKLGSSLSNKLTGIEVCAAGMVEKTAAGYEPWWNKPGNPKNTIYKEEEVRFTKGFENANDDRAHKGHYLKYTPEQEKSLVELLVWLHLTNPAVFKTEFIVGHDEISFDRKNDPGGSMSWFMKELRQRVADQAIDVGA